MCPAIFIFGFDALDFSKVYKPDGLSACAKEQLGLHLLVKY